MADFTYDGTITRYSLLVPFQTSINVTETNELFAPINKSPLTIDPNPRAPGSFSRAEGEAAGGAVTQGTSSVPEPLPAAALRNNLLLRETGSFNELSNRADPRAPERRLPGTGEVTAHPLSDIVTLSWGTARGPVTSSRGRAFPGDRHVPLRDGAAARPRKPRPDTKPALPLVACLANQLARRVPATMRACFQTISERACPPAQLGGLWLSIGA